MAKAPKTRGLARFKRMIGMGCFVLEEAQELCKQNWRHVPYWKEFEQDRKLSLKNAITMGRAEGESDTTIVLAFRQGIREIYKANNWLKKKGRKWVIDPWAMIRDYADRYKYKHPEYDSPWQKRLKNVRDYQRKAEATMRKQMGLDGQYNARGYYG